MGFWDYLRKGDFGFDGSKGNGEEMEIEETAFCYLHFLSFTSMAALVRAIYLA